MARLDKLTIKSQEALAEALELAADKGLESGFARGVQKLGVRLIQV